MYLLQLLICLARNGITDEKAKKHKKDRSNIANIVDYIDKNFDKKITLESLSNIFFMNQSALSRSFNAVVGVSVISYINLKRIEKAKELLENQDFSINSLSDLLGFNTTTYFEKVFKKITSLTPTEYKKHLVEE
jgi:YesN/AraC family two-component response regulator